MLQCVLSTFLNHSAHDFCFCRSNTQCHIMHVFDCLQHIFCEECIAQWLNQERTCPLCRTVITDKVHKWKDGATSAYLQIYWNLTVRTETVLWHVETFNQQWIHRMWIVHLKHLRWTNSTCYKAKGSRKSSSFEFLKYR